MPREKSDGSFQWKWQYIDELLSVGLAGAFFVARSTITNLPWYTFITPTKWCRAGFIAAGIEGDVSADQWCTLEMSSIKSKILLPYQLLDACPVNPSLLRTARKSSEFSVYTSINFSPFLRCRCIDRSMLSDRASGRTPSYNGDRTMSSSLAR